MKYDQEMTSDPQTRFRRITMTPPAYRYDGAPLMRWAASGLMSLTGPAKGTPSIINRDIAGRIDALREWIAMLAADAGTELNVSSVLVIGRAALMGLSRQGAMSCNGSAQMMRAADGWFVLNLARPDDFDLLPALFDGRISGRSWEDVKRATASASAVQLARTAHALGLPAAIVGESHAGPPIAMTALDRFAPAGRKRPLAIDLTSLWAGPLCGHILTRTGARVIKVESIGRPDAARRGCPAFFAILNNGKEMMRLDFQKPADIARLRDLLIRADIVIEASRPRALEQFGLSVDRIAADNPGMIWASITGHGRDAHNAMRVGFGDDAAAAAGLVVWRDDEPCFIGDAIADPIAGLMTAAAILSARRQGGGWLIDVSLRAAAAWVSDAPPIPRARDTHVTEATGGAFLVDPQGGRYPIRTPAAVMAGDL